MLASNSLSVLIAILSLVVALCGTLYSLMYAKTNVFHSIQRLMIDKAKECNEVYKQSVYDYNHQPSAIGLSKGDFNSMTTIDEIIKSVQLLENALHEYQQTRKRNFFLEQFWIQLDNRIRREVVNFEMKGISGKKNKDLQRVKSDFEFILKKYDD